MWGRREEWGGQGRASWLQARSPEKGHVGRGCSVGVWVGGLRTAVAGVSFLPHRRPGVVGRGRYVLGGDVQVLKAARQAAPRWLLLPWRWAATLRPNHGVTQTLNACYVPCPSTWPGVSVVVPTAGHMYARSAHRAPFCPRRGAGDRMWWAGRRPAVVWVRLDGGWSRAWGPLTKGSWGLVK